MSDKFEQGGQHSQREPQDKVWPDKMKLSQARKYLGVSVQKMSSLVKSGILKFETSPLDGRLRLVKRSDLEELKRKYAND